MATKKWMTMPDTDRWLASDAPTRLVSGMGLFAIGAIVGIGMGLLLAPKSGHELRQQITGRIARVRNRRRLPGGEREPDISMSPDYGTQTTPPATR